MIAAPPGWGPWTRRTWAVGIVAHVVGVLIGAVAVAWAWHQLGDLGLRPPLWSLGVLALLLALVSAQVVPVHLEGSPWRVPRSWARLRHAGYSGVFGAALGTGLLTALASPALYLLIGWGLTAVEWAAVWPVFLAFGVGRVVPFLTICAMAGRTTSDPYDALERVSGWTARLAAVEAVLLAVVGVWLLSG